MVLQVYPNLQKRPRFSELHTIYRYYIKKRFGNEGKATGMAQKRGKQLRNQARWPITWPAALTLEPIQNVLKQKKLPFDPNVKALLERLIRESQATGNLPQLSESDKLAIMSLGLGRYREVMQLAGFPMLEAKQMLLLEKFWEQQRGASDNS